MTSVCYIDELEGQRRELEVRRAMLEERFKLRLATAQEFGAIHTHRLGRVREAFVAQCGAARRRNQSIIDRVRQEQQLQRKSTQLGAIEEERFVTEQRRRVARQRFEQEQALAAVVSEHSRRLAAARAHERNELALRRAQRDRSAAEDREALKAALERVNEAGRAARHDVQTEISNNHRGHRDGNRSSSGERGGRGRRFIHSDEDEEEFEEEGKIGLSRRTKSPKNRAGANRSACYSSPRSARQADEEESRPQEERSELAREGGREGGRGGGRSSRSADKQLRLRDVFCATRRGSPKAAGGGWEERGADKPKRRGEEARRGRPHDGRRAEGAGDSRSCSPSLATRSNSRSEPSTTDVELNAKETRNSSKKRRDGKRHRHRNRSDEGVQEPPPLPPPPRLAESHGGSRSGEDCADEGRSSAVERTASHPKKKTSERSEPPHPPPQGAGSLPPPGGSRARSFSSSNGSGGALSPPGEAASSGTLGVTKEGRVETLQKKDGESAQAPTVVLEAEEKKSAAARTPSWSDEDEDDDGGIMVDPEEKPIRAKVPATRFSLAGDLDEVYLDEGEAGHVDGNGHDKAGDSALPAPTPLDQRSGMPFSLPATARAVAALTARIESLAQAQASAPVAGRNSPPASLLVLEAYRSVTAERHDPASWGTEMTSAAAAAAATTTTVHADDTRPSSFPELEAFGMAALCGAVLDLIAANATKLLPPEALSGIVTAAKVRAQHRRSGKAGRIQLFDAVVGHARRLRFAAEAASEGESSGGGAADPAAIAAIFATCFGAVIAAEVDARGAERLRRKVLALLESAADPNGASTKTRQTPSTEVAALPAMVAAAATGRSGGGGDGAGIEKPAGETTITSDHVADSKEKRQQQQGRWESSTSAVGASSGGVVLGGGRSVGSKKKKGGRLDLSSFGGSMGVFHTAGSGGNLPEFEERTSLELGKKGDGGGGRT